MHETIGNNNVSGTIQGSVVIESCPALRDTQVQLMPSRHAEPRAPTLGFQTVTHSVVWPLAPNQLLLHHHQHWEATCEADHIARAIIRDY